jgi:hypothetical protein
MFTLIPEEATDGQSRSFSPFDCVSHLLAIPWVPIGSGPADIDQRAAIVRFPKGISFRTIDLKIEAARLLRINRKRFRRIQSIIHRRYRSSTPRAAVI